MDLAFRQREGYSRATTHAITGRQKAPACGMCRLRPLCVGGDLDASTHGSLGRQLDQGGLLASGSTLFHQGDRMHAIHTVRSGFFKTSVYAADGEEHVTGFHMPGDVFGFDGIDDGVHHTTAVALQDASVCAFPYEALVGSAMRDAAFQRRLFKLMSREINRQTRRFGDGAADTRMAGFLLELSDRFANRGYSADRLCIFMPRRDIASHLGLVTETVSRMLTKFQAEGLVHVMRREIILHDRDRLIGIALRG